MRKIIMASTAALACYAGVAQAAPTYSQSSAFPLVNFGTGDGSGLQSTAPTMGYTFTGAGTGVYSGTGTGFTSPFGMGNNTNYLGIQPNGTITYTFSSAQTSLSLLFGTIDDYNSITFTTTGSSGTQTISGSDVANGISGMSANGTQTAYIRIGNLNPFTTVTFSDSKFAAFEFVPGAVPEPAAWGMMIVGFGLVGGVLRRRQTAVKVRFA